MTELWRQISTQAQATKLSLDTYLLLTTTIERTLTEFGVNTHPNSRLAKYDRALRELFRYRFNAEFTPDLHVLKVVAVAYLEVWQLAAIAHYLALPFANNEAQSKARQLLEDAALADSTLNRSTPGRDTQFELFLAATWTLAGHPCHMMLPPGADFAIRLGPYVFGMEAKRIKSLGSLSKRISKASHQLQSSPSGGLIATDLTIPVLNGRQFLIAPSRAAAVSDLERRIYSLMRSSLTSIRAASRNSPAFAWIGYCQSLYVIPGEGPFLAYQWKNFNLKSGDDPRWLQVVEAFGDLVLSAGRVV